jgi:Tfp pilus assembly protein FimT
MSLAEMIAALTVAALALGVATPAAARMVHGWRLDGAARGLAMEIHRARMEAIARARHAGISFQPSEGGRWRLHVDSNGDRSLTSAAIASGADRAIGPIVDLAGRHPGVRFGFPPAPIPRIPPATGFLQPTDDPIAFGSSDIFSAAPTGEGSAGTIYITDGRGVRAVVVNGATGRVRVWRWEPESGWTL